MTRALPEPSAAIRVAAVWAAVALCQACSAAVVRPTGTPLTGLDLAALWVEPENVGSRDLFWGPGGPESAPHAGDTYRMVELDENGHSRGYDVIGRDGREWKVKLGDEAQSEIVASRLLWAVGFHQPVMHAVDAWRLEGARTMRSEIARFRLKDGHRTAGDWSWQHNPYVGTREFKGLIVAQLLLNNWDLKTSNNRVYSVTAPGASPRRWFVVQDLGASLGATGWPTGTRNDVADFERQRLVRRIGPNRIEFDYAGRHRELFEHLEPTDVVWTCRRLALLSAQQWLDAFRAARYPDDVAQRFIVKLRSKIEEGLAMTPLSGNDF